MTKEGVLLPRRNPVEILLERIPELRAELDETDLDLPYVVYGFFGQYLQRLPRDHPILLRSFELLNELSESGDAELQNLVQVGVFESLVADARSVNLMRKYLRPAALELLESVTEM